MDEKDLPKQILWTKPRGERGRGKPKSRRKTQGNWVVEIGGWMSRIEDAGDICLRGKRPAQGCRADNNDGVDILVLGKHITNLM